MLPQPAHNTSIVTLKNRLQRTLPVGVELGEYLLPVVTSAAPVLAGFGGGGEAYGDVLNHSAETAQQPGQVVYDIGRFRRVKQDLPPSAPRRPIVPPDNGIRTPAP